MDKYICAIADGGRITYDFRQDCNYFKIKEPFVMFYDKKDQFLASLPIARIHYITVREE